MATTRTTLESLPVHRDFARQLVFGLKAIPIPPEALTLEAVKNQTLALIIHASNHKGSKSLTVAPTPPPANYFVHFARLRIETDGAGQQMLERAADVFPNESLAASLMKYLGEGEVDVYVIPLEQSIEKFRKDLKTMSLLME